MPADIVLRKLAGLVLNSPKGNGEFNELVRADNIMFDQDGLAQCRYGQHFIGNASLGETILELVNIFYYNYRAIFVSFEAWYAWDGSAEPTPTLTDLSTVAVSAGSRTAGNVVTLTVPLNHPVKAGNVIEVDLADNTYDGVYLVSSVTATTVVYTQSGGPGADAASGAGTLRVERPDQSTGNWFDGTSWEVNTKLYMGTGIYLEFVGGSPLIPNWTHIAGFPLGGRVWSTMSYHADRMWWASRQDGSAKIYFSAPGNPESWPAANFISIGEASNTFITEIRSFQNRLYIWTTDDMWVLETPGVPTTWILRRFAHIGCDGKTSIEYNGAMYWVGPTGVYRFDGGGIEKLSEPIEPVFRDRIRRLGIGHSYVDWAYVTVYRDQLIFTLNMETNVDRRVFCYSVIHNAWSEWIFSFQNEAAGLEPWSVFAIPLSLNAIPSPAAGLYMTWRNDAQHGFLTGINTQYDYKADEKGTRTGSPTITEYPVSVVVQTKHTDFDDAYYTKRVYNWDLEFEGGDVLVEQIDSRNVIKEKTVYGINPTVKVVNVTSGSRTSGVVTLVVPSGHGVVAGDRILVNVADADYDGYYWVTSVTSTTIVYAHNWIDDVSSGTGTVTVLSLADPQVQFKKVPGFGYCRKLALRLTVSNLRNIGFKLYQICGKVKLRGKQIPDQEQTIT